MDAVHSIGRPAERRSTRLGVRPLRRRRLGRQNVATRHLDPRQGNVAGGMPLAGSPTRGAGIGLQYGFRPHGDGPPAIRRLASQLDDAAPEISQTGVNVLVRGVTPGEPAHPTNRNARSRMKSV
jgi:hypothetical protein